MKDTNSKTPTATAARCPICNGTGHIISNGKQTPCTPCAGTGTRPDSAELDRLLLELDQLEAEAFSAWQRAEQTGSAADWEEANEAAARRDDAAADCYSFNPKETKEEAKDIMEQTPQPEQETGYNGWKNRSTWNISLWLNNDESLYNAARRAKVNGLSSYAAIIFALGLAHDKTPDGIAWISQELDYPALDAMIAEL